MLEFERLFEFGRHLLEHRDAARDVETADANRKTRRTELVREVHCPGVLVGLDAYQADEAAPALGADIADDTRRVDMAVDLVGDMKVGLLAAERDRVLDDSRQTGERIGRDDGAPPLKRIAIVIVSRRLDQIDLKSIQSSRSP